MDFKKLNMYQRLRDFDVPSAVLDSIFDTETDLKVLEEAWDEMSSQGMAGDEIARAVAELIFKEIDIPLDLD